MLKALGFISSTKKQNKNASNIALWLYDVVTNERRGTMDLAKNIASFFWGGGRDEGPIIFNIKIVRFSIRSYSWEAPNTTLQSPSV